MTRQKTTALWFLAFCIALNANAEVLTWRANAGQQYESRSTIKESVIGLDSITAKPVLVTKSAPYQEESAKNQSTVSYLKTIPAFPRSDITPGMKWTETGTITYDISAFGSTEPIVLELPVSYTFLEMTEIDGLSCFHIQAEWFPFYILKNNIAKKTGILRLSGASTMDLFWDNKSGCPKLFTLTEETQYLFNTKASLLLKKETTEEFKTVVNIVREQVLSVREQVVSDLIKQIATQNVANVEVKQTEEGIVLSIENIQFEAESAKLVETEKAKLTKIGGLLASLQNRKLNIIGHAANPAGSNEAELLALSTARAQSVADFLVQSGIKAADSVIATGMGGTKPLATNDTSEGRTKNRRVEILIMDEEKQQ